MIFRPCFITGLALSLKQLNRKGDYVLHQERIWGVKKLFFFILKNIFRSELPCQHKNNTKYTLRINRISAEEYLEKARTLFEEMYFQWDLDELDKMMSTLSG